MAQEPQRAAVDVARVNSAAPGHGGGRASY